MFDKAAHTFICKMEVALQLTEYDSLRGMKGEDDKRSEWYFSVYDFIKFVTDRHEHGESYARETVERLAKEEPWYASDIAGGCRNLKFHGSGEKETPCMTVNGLRWLLDMLDEMNLVKVVRFEIVKDVFIRYLRGDMSLIKEVRENAVSAAPTTTPVNVMAAMANPKKRKQLAELELDERDLKVRRMCVELVHDFVKAMSTLDEDWQEDDRLVQKTKDWCQNRVLE